jgi:putative superfamily III holin-X
VSRHSNGSLRSRHVGELVGDLSHDLSRLVKLEVELARSEVRDLADELRTQVMRTAAEAQTEAERGGSRVAKRFSENGKQAGAAGGLFVGAAVFALGAFGGLTAFLILVLAEAMPAWAAALVVIALYGMVAAVLVLLGRTRWQRAQPLVPTTEIQQTAENVRQALVNGKDRLTEAMTPLPKQTIETVKEDIEWAKHPTKSAAR